MTEQGKIKKTILILISVCFLACAVILPCLFIDSNQKIKVKITEICSSNGTIIADKNGVFGDYVEFYNAGESFMLTGFGLSNKKNNAVCYIFGETEFKSGEYLVVFFDGNDVPFKLSSSGGEYIGLIAPDGHCIVSVSTVASGRDEVMLLDDRGYTLSQTPSPGFPNTKEGVAAFRNRAVSESGAIVINEIFTSNLSSLPDENGNFADVIEIKNVSDVCVSLLGWHLSDSENNLTKYAFPDLSLESNEIFTVFASETYGNITDNHAPFGISVGEKIILSNGDERLSVIVSDCPVGYSQSRIIREDGGVNYEIMPASPGFENNENGIEAFRLSGIDDNPALVINEILFADDLTPFCGKLRDVIEICNVSDGIVSTDGWFISDSEDNPLRFALPEREVGPGEDLILFCFLLELLKYFFDLLFPWI